MIMNSDEPIYQQLHEELRSLIASDEFPVGAKFLSERQIADRFEVSRPTANKVLARLMAEQLLAYTKGVGCFVQEPVLNFELRDLVSFTEKAKSAGKNPETKVLCLREDTAKNIDGNISERLQVSGSDNLFYLERLRLADNIPMIYEQRYVIADLCPGLTEQVVQGSLYALWTEQYDLHIGGADQRIRAVIANADIAKALDCKIGDACFQVLCTGYQVDGSPLWWERTTYRGDAYELISRLGNQDDGQPVHGSLF